ncbi:MAG: ABC transporter substrate-binding protein [Candidatus Lustribacter sp.]|jgi:NitT/TauT family transport system substrate-binding protein
MNRRTLLGAGAAAALSTRVAAAGAQTASTVRIGIAPNDSSLVPEYALEQGFFRQAGLDVELQTISNGVAQVVLAGGVDVGVVDCVQVANALIHGFPTVAFAGGCVFSKQSPTLVLVTEKSSAIHGARDLVGQTLAVPSAKSLSSSMTSEWLRINGVDPATVKVIEMSFPQMNAALERGTIAAAVQGEPFLSDAKAEQRQLGVPFEAMGKPFYVNVYAASRDWINANPALAHRVAAALYDAGRWANAHRPETAVSESRFTKIPLDVAQTMARNVFATSFDPQLMQPVLDIAGRYQLTTRTVRAQEIAQPV